METKLVFLKGNQKLFLFFFLKITKNMSVPFLKLLDTGKSIAFLEKMLSSILDILYERYS